MQWRYTQSLLKIKAKQTLSQCKMMASVFWVLLVEFMQKLCRAIQNKRILKKEILRLHDARRHTAAQTQAVLDSYGWEVLDNTPFSLDLALCDFHLKDHLGGSRYDNDDEVKMAMNSW